MVDIREKSPLDHALRWDNDYDYYLVRVDTALYLMNKLGCGDVKDKVKLLCAACFQGKLNVVKELITEHKVDPNGERIVALCVYMFL